MSQKSRLLLTCICKRSVHTTPIRRLDPKQVEEVRIPVPWGHIAGKWWGDRSVLPVVALHGIQDNAASFDPLVPLLEVESLLSLDLPGHGFSSHLEPGLYPHFLDYVTPLRYVLWRHFPGRTVRLLSHSFGSTVSFAYAALYPESVDTYISIDCGRYNLIPVKERTVDELREKLDWQLESEQKKASAPPAYEFESLVKLMLSGRKAPMDINEQATRILLSRGSQVCDDGSGKVRLTRDLRLKERALGRLSEELVYSFSAKITCRTLYLTSSRGIIAPFEDKARIHDRSMGITSRTASHFESHAVDGKHHVHLEHPERVAPVINRFLNDR